MGDVGCDLFIPEFGRNAPDVVIMNIQGPQNPLKVL